MVNPPLTANPVAVVGNPDVAHSWTAMDDVTTLLARLGTDERALGRPWHVPTAPAISQRDLIHKLCEIAGIDPVKVRGRTSFELRIAGVFSKTIREVGEVLYQLDDPFVVDASDAVETFGNHPTPTEDVLAEIVATTYADQNSGG